MSKDIVEKENKVTLFELMDKVFDNERQKMQQIRKQLDNSIFNMWDLDINPVIKMGDMDEFQKSIEEFKKAHPDSKITARAYTFDSENPTENKIFEYTDDIKKEVKALPKKKENKKKNKPVPKKKK